MKTVSRLNLILLCFLILGAGASLHSGYPDYASIYNPVALSLDGGPGVSQITKFGFNKGLTSGGGNPTVEFEVKIWSQTQETIYVIYEDFIDTQVEDSRLYEDFKGQPILRKEIFYLEALTDAGTATIGTGRFKLICRKV